MNNENGLKTIDLKFDFKENAKSEINVEAKSTEGKIKLKKNRKTSAKMNSTLFSLVNERSKMPKANYTSKLKRIKRQANSTLASSAGN